MLRKQCNESQMTPHLAIIVHVAVWAGLRRSYHSALEAVADHSKPWNVDAEAKLSRVVPALARAPKAG
jgi:hypothetical protein